MALIGCEEEPTPAPDASTDAPTPGSDAATDRRDAANADTAIADAAAETGADVRIDATVDAGSDVTTDASIDRAVDASVDRGPDADASPDDAPTADAAPDADAATAADGDAGTAVDGAQDSGAPIDAAGETDGGHTAGFRATGDLVTARQQHTATTLADGRVLVVGGYNAGALQSAEIWDSTAAGGTGAFTATGNLTNGRLSHTATRLTNGKVLVAGGTSNTAPIASAEIFDPAASGGVGAFTATGNLLQARSGHTATLLPDGKVLIVAGQLSSSVLLDSAEIFDPAANGGVGAFSSAGSITGVRQVHAATLLGNGLVLIAGGLTNVPTLTEVATAMLFNHGDAGTGSFTSTGSLIGARQWPMATSLPGGKALITGGWAVSSALETAEIFDSAGDGGLGGFQSLPNMTTKRWHHASTLLSTGVVLLTGGTLSPGTGPLAEIFDPAGNSGAGTFTATSDMLHIHDLHDAAPLSGGRALVVGGTEGGGTPSPYAEVYDP